jgi:hypothetical protein
MNYSRPLRTLMPNRDYNLAFSPSSTILLINVPTPCEISTRNSSPCFKVLRGLADHPTPAGVLELAAIPRDQ